MQCEQIRSSKQIITLTVPWWEAVSLHEGEHCKAACQNQLESHMIKTKKYNLKKTVRIQKEKMKTKQNTLKTYHQRRRLELRMGDHKLDWYSFSKKIYKQSQQRLPSSCFKLCMGIFSRGWYKYRNTNVEMTEINYWKGLKRGTERYAVLYFCVCLEVNLLLTRVLHASCWHAYSTVAQIPRIPQISGRFCQMTGAWPSLPCSQSLSPLLS